MTHPPGSGPGLGEEPAPGSPLPGGSPGAPGPGREPDLRLGDFGKGGRGDACPPGPALTAAVAALSGPGWRCQDATDDELIGLLGRWTATESWAAAGKLGVLRELIRRRAITEPASPGDLPERWEEGTGHEVAAALAISVPAANKLTDLAWTLQARLPRIGAKLADGTIDCLRAKIIAEETAVLTPGQAAQAEALIIDQLAGKTPGQIGKLTALAVVTVDPDGARKRREHAEREDARIRFWREYSGASALAAYGLPTDAALSANENINQRAESYKKARVLPDATMGQFRVLAFLDMLNDIPAADRIAQAQAQAQNTAQPQDPAKDQDPAPGQDRDQDHANADAGHPDDAASHSPAGNKPSDDRNRGEGPADGAPGRAGAGSGGGPCDIGPGGSGTGDGREAARPAGQGHALPARANLTLPLPTLLGLAERPGAGHGLGPLDPALVRDLAAAAARSQHSQWCVTVVNAEGIAIGHGCARPARIKQGKSPPPGNRDGPWTFTRHDDSGPPGGFGCWNLTLPDGRRLTVKLSPVPVTDCDHRYESGSYQPSDTLRHLVEIRDGQCTFPSCSRHASTCDFEHAIPYDQGGPTCACNAGARSRSCHKVKQSKGWRLTQPRPGWHQWTTPSGRTYTKGPMRYPA
jgi:hypothetical protein